MPSPRSDESLSVDPSEAPFEDILSLVKVIELQDVVFYEERGRRITWDDANSPAVELPSYDNSLGIVRDDTRLEYRFRMVFTDDQAEYVSDVAAIYALPENRPITDAVQLEFAQKVAFMTIYPYLRASVFSSAARLGLPTPVMGIVRQGDFEPGAPMSDDDIRSAFQDNKSERL